MSHLSDAEERIGDIMATNSRGYYRCEDVKGELLAELIRQVAGLRDDLAESREDEEDWTCTHQPGDDCAACVPGKRAAQSLAEELDEPFTREAFGYVCAGCGHRRPPNTQCPCSPLTPSERTQG